MNVINLRKRQLMEFGYSGDETARVRGEFPFTAATGNRSSAAVYFELEPGKRLPTHTDSAEEILLILSGSGRLTIGREEARVSRQDMVVVPAMEPHGVVNDGEETLRVVGFFSSNAVLSTFDETLELLGAPAEAPPLATRTLISPMPFALEQAAESVVSTQG